MRRESSQLDAIQTQVAELVHDRVKIDRIILYGPKQYAQLPIESFFIDVSSLHERRFGPTDGYTVAALAGSYILDRVPFRWSPTLGAWGWVSGPK